MADTLLTILIPVYNGGRYLKHLLGLFADAYAGKPRLFERIEIVVANNASSDDTQSVAESFSSRLPLLRPLLLTPHMPTAEENVFRAFSQCNGAYTWTLGVDDIPNFECLSRVMCQLEKNEYDFYLFNFAVISQQMILRRSSNFFLNTTVFPLNIVDITQRLGFWFVMAGMSGQIVRTDCVKNYDLQAIITQASPIYAHVTAYMECFKSRKSALINEPIVFYKVSHADTAHWQSAAQKLGVFDEYFWTLGYIRQLEYLERKGIIEGDYLRYMLESDEFKLFRPSCVIAYKLSKQVEQSAGAKETRNQITRDEYNNIRDYLIRKDPFLREFLWRLDALFERVLGKKPVGKLEWYRVRGSLRNYQSDYIYASLFAGTFGKHEIFRIANRYYAVEPFARDLLMEYSRVFDKEDITPILFSGISVDEIRQKITSHGGDMDEAARQRDLNHKFAIANNELAKIRLKYDEMRRSFSWRITAPLRSYLGNKTWF